ncbi:MAG: hypothetical protein OES26_03015 [Gammaproteobacteria bacterium]|nr:hypothetical protein [Gammaproteobacteria bacterium]
MLLLIATSAFADIRFYRINKQGQQYRIELVRNSAKPGCHSFTKARKVFRVAQVRFAYCEVYSSRQCELDSILSARWTGKRGNRVEHEGSVTQLTPGAMWVLADQANVKVRSWRCEN